MASPRVFEVTIPSGIPFETGFAEARSRGAKYGIRVTGTSSEGEFTGVAQGRYRRRGRELTVWVEKKPLFITWGMIEAGLRRFERADEDMIRRARARR
jgi:hypothetical protein